MKKDYSILSISLSALFGVLSILACIQYLKYFPAFYISGMVIAGISFIASGICLILRLTKLKGQENRYRLLTAVSMFSVAAALCLVVIGTLVILFA